jgi:hypothetical protein
MADYYQHVSFCIDAPLDAARWIKDRIETRDENDDSLSGVSVELQPVKLDDRREAWIHDYDGYPNINVVAGVLAEAQEKFKLDDVWSFEWGNDCTKPRLDAYGGGAVVVADGEVRLMTTGDWVARHEGVVKTRRREEEEAAERRAQLNGKGRR